MEDHGDDMKKIITGVITEYNPFTNGHLHHINEARRLTKADYVVAIMSGDFTQRGTPALCDKFTRAKMAVSCGVDLVIELPVVYTVSCAEHFAKGAISILHQFACVDYVVFGSECDDMELLIRTATLLGEETKDFSVKLKALQAKGVRYPLAVQEVLKEYDPNAASILDQPNAILGIEYIKALQYFKSTIKPIAIKRQGCAYHSLALHEYASASAMREHLLRGADPKGMLPEASIRILQEYQKDFDFITEEYLTPYLHQMLMGWTDDTIVDMDDNLFHAIQKNVDVPYSYRSFIKRLITKNYTSARIRRVVLHMVLHMNQANTEDFYDGEFAAYARILAINKKTTVLIREIAKVTTISLINKMADREKLFEQQDILFETNRASIAKRQIQFDINADYLYHSMMMRVAKHNSASRDHDIVHRIEIV